MKDQIITSEDDLEDKLTELWETGSADLLETMFYDWMRRLEWVIEHEGGNYVNLH
jgi:hypothetical protein